MIINKFGGASIKSIEAINNTVSICAEQIKSGIIVVSAMGKTTNLLEKLTLKYYKNEPCNVEFEEFNAFHTNIINRLFSVNEAIHAEYKQLTNQLKAILKDPSNNDYDFVYDQIVPYGELASSLIISSYLNLKGIDVTLIDARTVFKTNNNYRNAKILWNETASKATNLFIDTESSLYITQGFIGSTLNHTSTTLGREGSDFSASVLAYVLNAKKVVVWKDVPGIMCADPDWMPDSEKIEQLAHHDAIELAFYGAKVIHPKTIKPLQNKKIPLQVRSFIDQSNQGTLINSFKNLNLPPIYIKKQDQVLITIKPTDYSFIIEENLSHIFNILAENKITVNLMQNSAVSFSIVVDNDLFRIKEAITVLKQQFYAKYNDNLELLTIRHHLPGAEKKVLNGRQILLEQHTRSVARYLVLN